MKDNELNELIEQGIRVLKYLDYDEGVVLGSILGQLHSEIKRLSTLINKEPPFMNTTYFVATLTFEGVELFLNKGGVWGEFSVGETILAPTLKMLDYHYYKWNNCYIADDEDVTVKKIKMNITIEDMMCKELDR